MQMQKISKLTAFFALAFVALAIVGCQKSNLALRQDARMAAYHGNLPEARDIYKLAADREPDDVLAQYELGRIYLQLDKGLDAQLAFEKADTLKPEDKELCPKILDGIAEALLIQNRKENLSAFLAEQASYYGQPRDYIRQGKFLAKMGCIDEAAIAYRKAAHFSAPDDPTTYIAIADFYESINDFENTRLSLRYAYYIDPNHPGLADRLRKIGIIPGPTIRLQPPKPAILK